MKNQLLNDDGSDKLIIGGDLLELVDYTDPTQIKSLNLTKRNIWLPLNISIGGIKTTIMNVAFFPINSHRKLYWFVSDTSLQSAWSNI